MHTIELTLQRATPELIDLLVPLRLEVLRTVYGLGENADLQSVEDATRRYYAERLGTNGHIEYLAYFGAELAGCGAASMYDVMPTVDNPGGRKAYIMNMYTRPQFRRRGVGRRVLSALIADVHSLGIDHIALDASDSGRPLYEKAGFVTMESEMLYVPQVEEP